MKKMLTKRSGVSLVELLIVIAITAALMPLAFASFANKDRTNLDSSTQILNNSLRLIHNNAESGVGPNPGLYNCPVTCPIGPSELLFGQIVVFGGPGKTFGTTFTASADAPTYSSDFASAPLKILGDTPPAGVLNYEPFTAQSLPLDLGYDCYIVKFKAGGSSSCDINPVALVFYKVNLHQAVLPVQTRAFTNSELSALNGNCNSATVNCFESSGTGEYFKDAYSYLILRFHSVKNPSLVSCIVVQPDANDVQYKYGMTSCQ